MKLILSVLESKKAEEIVVLDVMRITPFAETYVIATADNMRKLNALKEGIVEEMEKAKIKINHVEGKEETGWIIVDCYHIIVHLFSKEQRALINLDGLLAKRLA